MAKEMRLNEDARTRLQAGVDQLTEAVKSTLGPKDPVLVKRGIDAATTQLVSHLRQAAHSVSTNGRRRARKPTPSPGIPAP